MPWSDSDNDDRKGVTMESDWQGTGRARGFLRLLIQKERIL